MFRFWRSTLSGACLFVLLYGWLWVIVLMVGWLIPPLGWVASVLMHPIPVVICWTLFLMEWYDVHRILETIEW